MLDGEEIIQTELNTASILLSTKSLSRFTDVTPIEICKVLLTSKGSVLKQYHTSYGMVEVERHV